MHKGHKQFGSCQNKQVKNRLGAFEYITSNPCSYFDILLTNDKSLLLLDRSHILTIIYVKLLLPTGFEDSKSLQI